MNACVRYGWDKAENGEDALVSPGNMLKYPENGWSPLDTFAQSDSCPVFNMSHIVAYFVTRTVKDSLPAGDFKSVNKSAENLFRCGHVQSILSVAVDDVFYIKSKCLPEMRKDRVYCVSSV